MLPNGKLLQGRYKIKRLIAQGGMGAVYEAEAIHLGGIDVAVKETFFSEDQHSLRAQFQREAATLARLEHPALPGVKDHFTEGAGQFLVMKFIPGEDLEQLLRRRGSAFDASIIIEWADTLLDALEYIHSQYPPIIHRDIKPQNVKLTPNGKLFLIDFGLAKDGTTPTRAGKSLHAYTLAYAPLEQIKGAGTDVRSDLYSLGATLYHLLTNKLPINAEVRAEAIHYTMPDPLQPVHQVNAQIPFQLSAVIARSMAMERERRHASAGEMRQALRAARQTIAEEQTRREEEERLQMTRCPVSTLSVFGFVFRRGNRSPFALRAKRAGKFVLNFSRE